MTFWRDHPVLVTGATGLLGGWLVAELLERGARIVALVRDDVPDSYLRLEDLEQRCVIVRGELADRALAERVLLEYDIDAVFHLAAQTQVGVARRGPYGTLEANVRGMYTLLEAARHAPSLRAILVASSDKARRTIGSSVHGGHAAGRSESGAADGGSRAQGRADGLPLTRLLPAHGHVS